MGGNLRPAPGGYLLHFFQQMGNRVLGRHCSLDYWIDSLKNQLKSHINDTIKLQILSDLNWIFSGIDANVSKEYGLQELKLSNKIENKKWIAQSYNDIGISCYKLGLLDSALDYYKKSLAVLP